MAVASPKVPPLEAPVEKVGEHTLPASWWFSEQVFELEKRAIFSKSWLFCTHSSRFQKAGDYCSFSFMGMSFFVIKSKTDGALRAFHNVCRHRAYPVVRKERGSSTLIGCKYHGWTYNSDGKLTKAPHFDDVGGFKKEENSLIPIQTHVTDQGLVFVNFSCQPAMPFDQWFEGLHEEMAEFDFAVYDYHMSYELDGLFNWKTLMDGYQECYHCPTAHPGLSSAFRMNTYEVVPKTRYCRHYAEIVREEPKKEGWWGVGKKEPPKRNPGGDFNGLWVYLFPSNGVNCYLPAWYSIRVLPISATRTVLQYDIYTKKGLPDAEKKEFVDFLQAVELEDFNLCVKTQKNLNQGVYLLGFLHPQKERGVLFYQGLVRDMVKEHYASEVAAGGDINPASPGGATNAAVRELEELCSGLECGKERVEW